MGLEPKQRDIEAARQRIRTFRRFAKEAERTTHMLIEELQADVLPSAMMIFEDKIEVVEDVGNRRRKSMVEQKANGRK